MKKTIIFVFALLVIIGLFVFFKFNNNGDINLAMQAYNSGDYKKAYEELLPLAESGNNIAQNNLGNLYLNGVGVEKNYKKAVYWYAKSNEQGNIGALSNLAGMYQYGLGVKKDVPKAISMYEEAIKNNDPASLNNLGYIYIYGNHVKKNVKEGLNMISTAAEQYNSSVAQCNLGLIYYNGSFGIKKDYKKAFSYMKNAAENNYPEAQYNLGIMYYQGQGVQQNSTESYFWTLLAYKNRYEKAINGLKELENKISEESKKQEEEKVATWLKEHPKNSYETQVAQLSGNNS